MRSLVFRAGGRRVRYLLLTGCLILGVLGLGAVEAHAATPSSLAGETFTTTNQQLRGSTLSGTCNGTSEGSVHFSVSGTAAGPFPGTFTESGSFSTIRAGFFTSFSSTFTITSTAGTVTGTGSLPKNSEASASCVPVGPVVDVRIGLGINYSATIPGGGQDTGTAVVNMLGALPAQLFSFSESFGSTGALPPPTGTDQCKHGGWRSFGTMFKNQGDCVSFVEHHDHGLQKGGSKAQLDCQSFGGTFTFGPLTEGVFWSCDEWTSANPNDYQTKLQTLSKDCTAPPEPGVLDTMPSGPGTYDSVCRSA